MAKAKDTAPQQEIPGQMGDPPPVVEQARSLAPPLPPPPSSERQTQPPPANPLASLIARAKRPSGPPPPPSVPGPPTPAAPGVPVSVPQVPRPGEALLIQERSILEPPIKVSVPVIPSEVRSPVASSPAAPPAPKWYRVVRTTRAAWGGAVHTLHEGAVVCELTHDLALLRSQGVALVESDPPKMTLDAYGRRPL